MPELICPRCGENTRPRAKDLRISKDGNGQTPATCFYCDKCGAILSVIPVLPQIPAKAEKA